MRSLPTLIALVGIAIACHGAAQNSGAVLGTADDNLISLGGPVRWPSPESIVNGLKSSKEEVRLAALKRMGITEEGARRAVWLQGAPTTRIIGNPVVTPDQIQLTYAPLGETEERQAILAIYIAYTQTTAVAVAIPVANGWKRIAALSCWCRYDLSNGVDALGELVRLVPAPGWSLESPQRFELVLRGSGGGSGLYNQTETHFRVRGDRLQAVLSFTSRRRSCNPISKPPTCQLERRWFDARPVAGKSGGVLVEGDGSYSENGEADAFWDIRNLEIQVLRQLRCTDFRWDVAAFRYEQTGPGLKPCAQGTN